MLIKFIIFNTFFICSVEAFNYYDRRTMRDDVNSYDETGHTKLHWQISYGNPERVAKLIAAGADLSLPVRGKPEYTALGLATLYRETAVETVDARQRILDLIVSRLKPAGYCTGYSLDKILSSHSRNDSGSFASELSGYHSGRSRIDRSSCDSEPDGYHTAACLGSSTGEVFFGNEFAILKKPGARATEIGDRRRRRNAAKLEMFRDAQLSPKVKLAVDDDLNTKSSGWFGWGCIRSKYRKK